MDRNQFLESVSRLREGGKSIRAVASELGVHPSRVQRALKVLAQRCRDEPVALTSILRSTAFVGRQQAYQESVEAAEACDPCSNSYGGRLLA